MLIDIDEKMNVKTGQTIGLENGYTLTVDDVDVNGKSVRMELFKDGKSKGMILCKEGDIATHEEKIGDEKITMIAVNVDSVFQGKESSTVTIEGIFQISDELVRIDQDKSFGKMEVSSSSDKKIELVNKQKISLSKGKNESFMTVGDTTMYFRTGDSDALRFYPYTLETVGSATPMSVTLSPSSVTLGNSTTITVKDNGTVLSGVTVKANDTTVGTTDDNGNVTYTPKEIGTFKITASKAGYTDGSTTLTVKEHIGSMTMSVTPSGAIYEGTDTIITVVDADNGTALSGVSITVSGGSSVTTNASGQAAYTFAAPGTVSLTASKSKYNNATTSVTVKAKAPEYTFSDFVITPEVPASGSKVSLTFNVSNVGVLEGETTLRLVVTNEDGVSEETETVRLGVNETKEVTMKFKPKKEGTYALELYGGENKVTLPSNMSNLAVEKGSGTMGILKTAAIAAAVIAALAVLAGASLFAVQMGKRGADRDNYKDVARETLEDMKRKISGK